MAAMSVVLKVAMMAERRVYDLAVWKATQKVGLSVVQRVIWLAVQ
jgi:hypothetical protein